MVFSRQERLKQWMEQNDIDYESRRQLIVRCRELRSRLR